MGCYVMVGLASRRILLHPTTDHMVAQVFRLQQPHGGETSIRVRQTHTVHALLPKLKITCSSTDAHISDMFIFISVIPQTKDLVTLQSDEHLSEKYTTYVFSFFS